MLVIYNGQENPISGWFVDVHGHRLFLRRGDLAPICPHLGPAIARWRLTQEVAEAIGPASS